jgi:hypothetical protein
MAQVVHHCFECTHMVVQLNLAWWVRCNMGGKVQEEHTKVWANQNGACVASVSLVWHCSNA